MTAKLGLNDSFQVMASRLTGLNETPALKGAVAIAQKGQPLWGTNDLNKLGMLNGLISHCYELNLSLSNNQSYSSTIMESINTAIFAINTEGTMVHFNKAAEKIFKCKAEWAVGRHYFETIHQSEKEKLRSSFDYVMNTGNSYIGNFVELKLLNGHNIIINPYIGPWRDLDGEIIGAIGIMTDETENKYFQDQLVKAEKMAVLGRVAAQMSHEMRSPLATIRGFARIIEKNEPESSKYKKYSKTIIEQVDRVNMVIQDLLDFGKPDSTEFQAININDLLKQAKDATMFNRTKIMVNENYYEYLPFIHGDYQKLMRVFINLIQNASQAIEDTGLIDIETAKKKGKITVTIKDSGPGIPNENIKKIFDPYYTTKPMGTGLGLAIVQQILQSHKATIQVKSNLGLGTCFYIEFPF